MNMGLVQILTHLHLGTLDDVLNVENLLKVNACAICTVDTKPLPPDIAHKFICKRFPLLDMKSEDLFPHITEFVTFVDTCRANEQDVVVHCNAGQSRSAAFIIGYLMWKLQMSYDDSLKYVKKLKPDVLPNEGFEEQLQLYETMGWQVDKSCKEYRLFQLQRITEMLNSGHVLSQLGMVLGGIQESSAQPGSSVAYKCRKCRMLLFRDGNLIPHQAGVGDAAFSRPWQKHSISDRKTCESGLFVEPMKWMERLGVHEPVGKISCVKCSAKIGSWAWPGERCSCGTWVTPAFHIDMKKVDRSASIKVAGSSAVG